MNFKPNGMEQQTERAAPPDSGGKAEGGTGPERRPGAAKRRKNRTAGHSRDRRASRAPGGAGGLALQGARFDTIFTQCDAFRTLDRTLKRLHSHKAELLLVLERPDLVLHTNGRERDIRGFVKWRKISGGTRSDLGKACRDGFASLNRTCRKLGVSFWDYLGDRINQLGVIPPLPDLIRQRATAAAAAP